MGIPNVDLSTPSIRPCALVDDPFAADLTWLVHRVEQVLATEFDAACRRVGLTDLRDTLVLAVAGDGTPRRQIEIAGILGLDKTTLGAILDRLEGQGLIVRRNDPGNKRIRIPETTVEGRAVLERAFAERDRAVAARLGSVSGEELRALRLTLNRIVTSETPALR